MPEASSFEFTMTVSRRIESVQEARAAITPLLADTVSVSIHKLEYEHNLRGDDRDILTATVIEGKVFKA